MSEKLRSLKGGLGKGNFAVLTEIRKTVLQLSAPSQLVCPSDDWTADLFCHISFRWYIVKSTFFLPCFFLQLDRKQLWFRQYILQSFQSVLVALLLTWHSFSCPLISMDNHALGVDGSENCSKGVELCINSVKVYRKLWNCSRGHKVNLSSVNIQNTLKSLFF